MSFSMDSTNKCVLPDQIHNMLLLRIELASSWAAGRAPQMCLHLEVLFQDKFLWNLQNDYYFVSFANIPRSDKVNRLICKLSLCAGG